MVIKTHFPVKSFGEISMSGYTCVTIIIFIFLLLWIMVEAIRYTYIPLENEKAQVIQTAIMELTDTIARQDEKLDVLEQYTVHYLEYIKTYESGYIDFSELLQKLQPLQTIPNPDYHKNIDEFNSIVSIINALNYSPHHEPILKKQCLRLQELLHPTKSLLAENLDYWELRMT